MNRFPVLAAVLLAAVAARADEAPLAGDLVGGARLYRLHCAACHGLGGDGSGPMAAGLDPKPGHVRDGGYLFSHTDDELLAKIQGQDAKGPTTYHGRGLTPLEARDILAWLRLPVPSVGDLFPASSAFIAHKQVIDQYGLERAEKSLGAPLPDAEKTVMLFTVFKPDDGQEKGPRPLRVPEDPAPLYDMKPKRKLGFIAYLPLKLDGGTVEAAVALNRTMHLVAVRTLPSSDEKLEALRKKLQPTLDAFAGAGGRDDKRPIEPQTKGVKAPKDVQAAMQRAYTRVLEGAAMYEKEERDRFWADPDAFKFPGAVEQPDDVKFDFKQKGSGKK